MIIFKSLKKWDIDKINSCMKHKTPLIINTCVILALLLGLIIFSLKKIICQNEFGPELNQRRQSLHIPVIPKFWRITDKDNHYVRWMGKEGVTGHKSKGIVFSKCEVEEEIDLYILEPQNNIDRNIEFIYKYSQINGSDSLQISYQVGNFDKIISRHSADSIFESEKIRKDY